MIAKPLARLAVVAVLATGCYTLQPVVSTGPLLGEQVALAVNDVGRVALGGTVGPEISEIEGRLVQNDNSEYVLSVSTLRLLRGGEQVWTGEKVRVKSEYVSSVKVRKFSKKRSVTMGAVGAGVVAFMLTRAIVTAGSRGQDPTPIDTGATLRRARP